MSSRTKREGAMVGGVNFHNQPTTDCPNVATSGQSTDSDSSEQASSNFDSGSPQSSGISSVPPRAEEWDRTLRHIELKEFGKSLENAARAIYPNDKKSRYSMVYVLLICWKTGDPKLPVQREISELRKVFEQIYHYEIEEFSIPDSDSHAAVSEKINAFVKVNDNSGDDLKIVYYAGHSRLSRTKELIWSNLPDKNGKGSLVVWSGIQRSLEMAQSDVLILLDCCSSGVANSSEGSGVTELICACPFDTKANGVGHYSFTQALITELRCLSKKPCISVGELYTSIYTRIQFHLSQGIENERYPAPIHLVLTEGEPFTRGIKLSVQGRNDSNREPEKLSPKRGHFEATDSLRRAPEDESIHSPRKRPHLDTTLRTEQVVLPWIDASENLEAEEYAANACPSSQRDDTSREAALTGQVRQPENDVSICLTTNDSLFPCDAPRALFAVRFKEDVRGEDLSVELFREWLRSIPAAAEDVRVEAGFKCFSTLMLVTMPIAMCSYIPQNDAVFFLGGVNSPVMLPLESQSQSLNISTEKSADAFMEDFSDTGTLAATSSLPTSPLTAKPLLESKFDVSKLTLSDLILKSPPSCIQNSNSNGSLASPTSFLQTDIRTPPGKVNEIEWDLSSYTVRLQEYGNVKGLRPLYTYVNTQSDPERFVCTVTFGKWEARGKECSNKRSAKHEASKSLWGYLNSNAMR